MVRYKNSEESGCIICVNQDLANVVNPLLINAEKSLENISEELRETYGIYLTVKDLEKHRDHIIREVEVQEDFDNIVKFNQESKNIDIINKEISKLEIVENNLIKNRKTDTPTYINVIKMKQHYIEMKMKIEGENTQTVEFKLPSWIKRIDEPEQIEE